MNETAEGYAAHSILEWTEADVHSFFSSLGYPYYEDEIEANGLSGEVLVHVGHDALKDIGVTSVGQRLAILKAVYSVKLRDDIPLEDGQWIPPAEDWDQTESELMLNPAKLAAILGERDNRLKALELEIKRLSASLEGCRDELSAIARAFYTSTEASNGMQRSAGHDAAAFPTVHPGVAHNEYGHSYSHSNGSTRTSPFLHTPLTRSESSDGLQTLGVVEPNGGLLESPLISPQSAASSGENTRRLHPTVLTLHAATSSESMGALSQPLASHVPNGPLSAVPQSITGTSPLTPTPGTPNQNVLSLETGMPRTANGSDSFATLQGSAVESLRPALADDENGDKMQESLRTEKVIDPFAPSSPTHGKSMSAGPLSSFKVTLEDPCSKVLPAALRKYKINDDWRLYALFLCYGNNVERCLALDERPLLLFQKLKENDMNPVFMLRHIKDIRSPMSIAASKHASRRERRQREAEEKTITASTTIAEAVAMSSGELSPVKATRESELGSQAILAKDVVTFGVAVYPYFAERPDELHVQLRDGFEIDAKAKGWWRVRRPRNSAKSDTDHSFDLQLGWVPSGCLVEVSRLAPAAQRAEDAKSIVHAPGSLLSQHVNGPALLDYEPHGDGELQLCKGETLAVYKRYSSWSYVVRTSAMSCEGGWAPSWMVGRGTKASPS